MKVAQNDETIPDTQSVRPPHPPNLSNPQLSPSGSSARQHETPGILSRMIPPLTSTTSYRVRARLASLLDMSCIDMHLFACIHCFFPLFSSVDPETAVDAPVIGYVTDNTSSLSAELPGKPPL